MMRSSLLSLLLIVVLTLTAERCSEEYEMPDSLYGSWIHSHEEDFEGNRVYRHASYNFPPSRGRERFDVRPDKTLLYYGIAPTDGLADPEEGKWRAINERTIEVSIPTSEGSDFAAELVEISNDRLVMRKLAESKF